MGERLRCSGMVEYGRAAQVWASTYAEQVWSSMGRYGRVWASAYAEQVCPRCSGMVGYGRAEQVWAGMDALNRYGRGK